MVDFLTENNETSTIYNTVITHNANDGSFMSFVIFFNSRSLTFFFHFLKLFNIGLKYEFYGGER